MLTMIPMDMLHDATQYLDRVRQALIEADRFEDILQVRTAGEGGHAEFQVMPRNNLRLPFKLGK